MTTHRTAILAIAVLVAGLLIGGTGGAVAAGKIGTGQLKNNAVTSPKIKNKTVRTADLAPSARGARVVQYVADGAVFDAAATTTVRLPGSWDADALVTSAWDVQLVRFGSGATVFPLGRSAPAGEQMNDGFYVYVSGGAAYAFVNASSYGSIDEIRITRTISTQRVTDTVLLRSPARAPASGG